MPVDSIGTNPASVAARTPSAADQVRERPVETASDPAQRQLQEPGRSQQVVADTNASARADQQTERSELRRPVDATNERQEQRQEERRQDTQDATAQRQQRLDQAISNASEAEQTRRQLDERA